MVITEAPRNAGSTDGEENHLQPFWFCGGDDRSLRAYISKFLLFLRSNSFFARARTLSDLSFNLARQSNRSLGRALIFQARSAQDLSGMLEGFCKDQRAAVDIPSPPNVILCFGGQISTFVGLDREIFQRTTVLKEHLDQCNLICKSLGLEGIYPAIFQRTPIEDIVKLQTALFAMQYSCAQSWIDCGIKVCAVVGHSFGEIVAQTVAGALTLADGLKVIARRAKLIRDCWCSDRGTMIAVEADLGLVEDILRQANKAGGQYGAATVACFNGPRSFTLAGPARLMQDVEDAVKGQATLIRYKKLNTSHAFHSTLVEALLPELEQIGNDITFSKPNIRVERATLNASRATLTTTYFAQHLRQPVYFNHAVQRLAGEYENSIWLEAGSQSTVTNMAAKALAVPGSARFQGMNLTSDDSWQRLAASTVALWKQGLNVSFWPHHSSQSAQYTPLLLPPYQFEKSKHFLELKQPQQPPLDKGTLDNQPGGLWTFVRFNDAHRQSARFCIETNHKTFQDLMAGHTVAHSQPLCPSTLQLDIATEAIQSLCPEYTSSDFQMDLRNLENQAPICRDSSRVVWLDVDAVDHARATFTWKIVSNPVGSKGGETLHASGRLLFRSRADAEFLGEFRRFERLVTHRHCLDVLGGSDADEILQGSGIYKLFSDVVDYSEVFRGVRKVVGRGSESAGRVVKKYSGETWLDTPLCDSFCQVAGVFVNCMTQRANDDAFISNGVERVVRSPFLRDFDENPEVFDVLALHHRPTDRSFSSDVFIFDHRTSQFLGAILGIQYQRVSKTAMAKLLARLTPGAEEPVSTTTKRHVPKTSSQKASPVPADEPTSSNLGARIAAVIAEMVGVEQSTITTETNLADLGIDSLMGMEITRELELAFKCALDMSEMLSVIEFRDLVKLVGSVLGEVAVDTEDEATTPAQLESWGDSENSSSSSSSSTAPSSMGEFGNISKSPSVTDLAMHARKSSRDRETAVDLFVSQYSCDFSFPSKPLGLPKPGSEHCVLITGATGSLGAHLVEHHANLPSVGTVICLNRPSNLDAMTRQQQSLAERGIFLSVEASEKLEIITSDTSRALLGLDAETYASVANRVTHVVHNAWPMSITRSVSEFEKQFMAMRNLIDLARDASHNMPVGARIGFQFISSIATVGLYPVVTGLSVVAEEQSKVEYALSSGYSDAKLVCEKLLSETLNRYPEHANAMAVRVGQVAGSRSNGYWNPAEHFSLIVKSAATLKALPDLPGYLSWLPVNDVAAVLGDLVLSTSPCSPIYHVENPKRQPWSNVISVLAAELEIDDIVPYEDWLERVRGLPDSRNAENPAKKVMQFLEDEFLRMACGGLVLGTEKAIQSSETLERASSVPDDLVRSYVRWWKSTGFL